MYALLWTYIHTYRTYVYSWVRYVVMYNNYVTSTLLTWYLLHEQLLRDAPILLCGVITAFSLMPSIETFFKIRFRHRSSSFVQCRWYQLKWDHAATYQFIDKSKPPRCKIIHYQVSLRCTLVKLFVNSVLLALITLYNSCISLHKSNLMFICIEFR